MVRKPLHANEVQTDVDLHCTLLALFCEHLVLNSRWTFGFLFVDSIIALLVDALLLAFPPAFLHEL